jgi:hypothetical protein
MLVNLIPTTNLLPSLKPSGGVGERIRLAVDETTSNAIATLAANIVVNVQYFDGTIPSFTVEVVILRGVPGPVSPSRGHCDD